jgi:hypothetical protein
VSRFRKGPCHARTTRHFKMQDGAYVWKAAAQSFEVAKSKVEQLAATAPGEYIIFNQTTGDNTIVKLESSA